MRLIRAFVIGLLFVCSGMAAQNGNAHESLVVVHYDDERKAVLGQSVYVYNFTNGVYTGRQLVLTVKGRENDKDLVRLDAGENLLYKDRYLISPAGDIVDLKEKKVLYDGSSQLVYCRNDSVVLYTNDVFKGKFYSCYNLQTNTCAEIKSLTYKAIPGQDVEFDKRQSPYKLFLYPTNKPKVLLLDDAGYGAEKGTDPALYWTDNNTFIVACNNQGGTGGSIVKYAIDTKNKVLLGSYAAGSNPRAIRLNSRGHYELVCPDKLYDINPAQNTVTELQKKPVGDHYEAEVGNKPGGRLIFSGGKQIGRYHCSLDNMQASARYMALVKELVAGTESYQQGIAVWDDEKQQWQNIDADEVASLAGWIKQ